MRTAPTGVSWLVELRHENVEFTEGACQFALIRLLLTEARPDVHQHFVAQLALVVAETISSGAW